MQEHESELSKVLLFVIDKYERGTEDYDALCVAAEQEDAAAFNDTQEKVSRVREATNKTLRSKIYDGTGKKTDRKFSALLKANPRIGAHVGADDIQRAIDDRSSRKPASDESSAEAAGPLRTSRPDLALIFAKEFVSRLDAIVSRVERLDDTQYHEVLSPHLRSLLQEAHRCYLNGFERACAVLCGAILEEAIRQNLGKNSTGSNTLGSLIENAKGAGLLEAPFSQMAMEVMRLRNDAAHGKPSEKRPHEGSENLAGDALTRTRAVVNALYSQQRGAQ